MPKTPRPPDLDANGQPVGAQPQGHSTTGMFGDVLTGIGKGAGQTAFNLGNLVHKTPLLGQLTDKLATLVGPEGTDPEAAFSKNPQELEATNTAQKVGKVGEQVGEFFIPASASRLATVKGLVKLIPDTASPQAMALANKMLAQVGRVLGEAGSAAGVSAVHGDETPEKSAEIAGGTTAAGAALGATAKALLKTTVGRELAPYLTAIAAMNIVSPFTPGGMASTVGAFGLTRSMANRAFRSPKLRTQIGTRIAQGASKLGEAAAGAESEYRVPQRRRLKELEAGP